eukprot:TRINITY_DN1957_c0_g1_i2.p1 TRINITY_DN1957_c0_g1~~TRINITY_DN1957_c0_g1_i2.p1  ORF type:complete len:125 (+),score=35.39 TRINITY_DN1957_c0_g1_i2:182-556(+)
MSEEELHTQEIRQYLYQSGVLRFLVAGKEIVKDIRQLQFTFDELVKDVQTEGGKVERIFDKWEENTDHFFQFSQFLSLQAIKAGQKRLESKLTEMKAGQKRMEAKMKSKLTEMSEKQEWVCKIL